MEASLGNAVASAARPGAERATVPATGEETARCWLTQAGACAARVPGSASGQLAEQRPCLREQHDGNTMHFQLANKRDNQSNERGSVC